MFSTCYVKRNAIGAIIALGPVAHAEKPVVGEFPKGPEFLSFFRLILSVNARHFHSVLPENPIVIETIEVAT